MKTIMKELKNWSMVIIMLITLPILVACGKDEDKDNQDDGTAINYTIDEIKEMLYGEWDVCGNLSISFPEATNDNFYDDFYGVLEFSKGEVDYIYLSLKVTKGKVYSKLYNGKPCYVENNLISESKKKCSIIRKMENTILKLTKNTDLKLYLFKKHQLNLR